MAARPVAGRKTGSTRLGGARSRFYGDQSQRRIVRIPDEPWNTIDETATGEGIPGPIAGD